MGVSINYGAVLAAAAANYIIGAIWYGAIFGKPWKALSGVPEMRPTAANTVIGFMGALALSFVLAHALVFASAYMGTAGVKSGLMAGFFNWFGFIAPVTLGTVLYEKKSWKLWILNNAYWLVSLLAMGTILAVWN
jgi:hypothetical protein